MADIRIKIMLFQHDGTVVSQYLLGEGVHAIGRDPNSAIYAESKYISNEHAKLYLTDEGIFIEDLNSTSGTFLDDVNVRGKLRLNPGQRLRVGDLYIDLQLEAAGDLAPGVKIGAGRYKLVKELGRGAMGQVWLVEDSQLDELVAIKVLPSDVSNDALALLDLKREVQKSRKLSHDNIIRIHDLVQLPGENPFISLEYVEGTDLLAIQVNQPGRIFGWEEIKPYVLQLCAALDYAHECKIVHRDLKPSNIMVTHDGVLKLADFGIAATIADTTGRSSMADIISGTPQFMSPQQMLGEPPNASDDIYALGATMYCLLTGRPPFHTGDIAQQSQHVTPAPLEKRLAESGLQNEVPDYVNVVVMSCLAKDPTARPTNAGAIGEWIRTEGQSKRPAERKKTETGIEKIVAEKPGEAAAEPETQAQPTQEPPTVVQAQRDEEKKSPVLAIAAAFIVVAGLGWFFMSGSGDQDENQNTGQGLQSAGLGTGETASGTQKPDTLLWEFETGAIVEGSPSLGIDGTVYVGSHDKKLYAINGKSGFKLWEFETGRGVQSSPAIGSDGTVYVGARDGKMYALNGKTGGKLWEFQGGGESHTSPAIGSDGTVYVGFRFRGLCALDGKSGVMKWVFRNPSIVTSSPVLGSDGLLYVGFGDRKFYALDSKSGTETWSFETGGLCHNPAALGADGTVYMGSWDGKVYALNGKTGGKKWEFDTGMRVFSSPLVGADNTIYVRSMKTLYALNGNNGAKIWVNTLSLNPNSFYGDSSPVIGLDGTIYVGSHDKKIFAIKSDSKGPAKSPWPMYGQNAERTGRAPK